MASLWYRAGQRARELGLNPDDELWERRKRIEKIFAVGDEDVDNFWDGYNAARDSTKHVTATGE